MAEGLAKHFLGSEYDVFSAGSRPAERIHPMAIAVMAEIGIHIHDQKTKTIDSVDLTKIDTVITLCAEEECPVLPTHVQRHSWPMSDPATSPTAHPEDVIRKFRKVRDEIRKRILDLRASSQTW